MKSLAWFAAFLVGALRLIGFESSFCALCQGQGHFNRNRLSPLPCNSCDGLGFKTPERTREILLEELAELTLQQKELSRRIRVLLSRL